MKNSLVGLVLFSISFISSADDIDLGNGVVIAEGYNVADIQQIVQTIQRNRGDRSRLIGQVVRLVTPRDNGSERVVWKTGDNGVEVNYFVQCNLAQFVGSAFITNCRGAVYVNSADLIDLRTVRNFRQAIRLIETGDKLVDLDGVQNLATGSDSISEAPVAGRLNISQGWYDVSGGQGFLNSNWIQGPNGNLFGLDPTDGFSDIYWSVSGVVDQSGNLGVMSGRATAWAIDVR